MKTIILAAILALATAACSTETTPPAREFSTPDIAGTIAAIVAQTQTAPTTSDASPNGSPTRTNHPILQPQHSHPNRSRLDAPPQRRRTT